MPHMGIVQLSHYLTISPPAFRQLSGTPQYLLFFYSRPAVLTSARTHICPHGRHTLYPTPCLRISLPSLARPREAIPQQTNSRVKVKVRLEHNPAPPPSNPTIRLRFSARPFHSRLRHPYHNNTRRSPRHRQIHHSRSNGRSVHHRSRLKCHSHPNRL